MKTTTTKTKTSKASSKKTSPKATKTAETKVDKIKLPKKSWINQEGRKFTFDDYKGQGIVLYFYPKDNTPGCTLEGQDFNRILPQLGKRITQC